MVTVIAILAG